MRRCVKDYTTIVVRKMRSLKLSTYKKIKSASSHPVVCWSIEAKTCNYYYTAYHADLVIDGLKYKAGQILGSSSIEQTLGFDSDNYEASMVFEDHAVGKDQVLSGDFDNAYVEVFMVYPEDLAAGKIPLNCGYITNIKLVDDKFTFEVSGLSSKLDQEIATLYSPYCRATFGDNKCKVNRMGFRAKTSILQIIAPEKIKIADIKIIQANLIGAEIKFISGKAFDHTTIILEASSNVLLLRDELRDEIKVGDILEITPNCDKKFTTCCSIYNNAVNFRGEPCIPGIDEILKTAGTYK